MTGPATRGAILALVASFTFHFMLPVATGVPGFSTFTLTKVAGLAVAAASVPALRDAGFRAALAGAAEILWPFLLLAAGLLKVSLVHGSYRELDLKLVAGFAGAVWVGLVLAAAWRDADLRARAIRVALWLGGALALVGGVLEPLTSPEWDGLWRWFRPYQPSFNPVAGRHLGLTLVHWQWGPVYRVSGFFADPNHLAGFLDLWFPLAICFLAVSPPRGRWARAGARAALGGLALVLASTLTRSAVLAAGAGGGLLALGHALAGPRRSRAARWRGAWAGGLAGAGAGALVLVIFSHWSSPFSAGSVAAAAAAAVALFGAATAGPARRLAWAAAVIFGALPLMGVSGVGAATRLADRPAVAVSWRQVVWRHAALALREAPLTGFGYNAFYARVLADPAVADPGVDNPHNLYLTAAVAGGMPLAGLLIHGLLVLLRIAWRRALAAPADAAAGAMAWYWTTFVLLGLVGQNIIPVNEGLFFFSWAGLTVAVCAVSRPPARPPLLERLAGGLAPIRRWVARGIFGSLCCYFLLPVQTSIPGFATFTLLKALVLVLLALSVPAWGAASTRRETRQRLVVLAPLAVLAVWLIAAALPRPTFALLDAKMLAGVAVGLAVSLVLARALGAPGERAVAVRIVLAGGTVALAAALVEPFLPPAADAGWRWFRPNLAVWNPVLGHDSHLAGVHWDAGGIFRVSGVFSNPNELANFLVAWFPLLAAVLSGARSRSGGGRVAVWAGVIMACFVFTLTLTRSSLLGAGLGCGAAMALLVADVLARGSARVRRAALRSAPAAGAGIALVAVGTVLGLLFRDNRATAISVAAVGAVGVAVLWLLARRMVVRVDRPLEAVLAPVGAVGVVVLLTPVFLLGPNPLASLGSVPSVAARGLKAGHARPEVRPTRWWPEMHQPVTPGERFAESTAHAGWQRHKLWIVACWMLREAPVAGPGYHAYFATIQGDRTLARRVDLDPRRGDIDAGVDNPHNLYLTAAVAGGLVAVGLLVHGLIVLVRLGLAAALARGLPAPARALGLAMAWYWCAFAGMGLVGQNIFTINDGLTFFVWVALTVSLRPVVRAAR